MAKLKAQLSACRWPMVGGRSALGLGKMRGKRYEWCLGDRMGNYCCCRDFWGRCLGRTLQQEITVHVMTLDLCWLWISLVFLPPRAVMLGLLEADWPWQIFVLTGGGFQGTMNFLKREQCSTLKNKKVKKKKKVPHKWSQFINWLLISLLTPPILAYVLWGCFWLLLRTLFF